MSPYLAEAIGTALLVVFGNGVVANVSLARTKGHGAGWIVIAAGWGVAVYIGAFCANEFSGAHLNPAVTIALAIADEEIKGDPAWYIVAQMAGAMVGGTLVYLFYMQHFKATDNADAKRGCFCTSAAIDNPMQSLFCEALGTFCLILPIFLMTDPSLSGATADAAKTPIGLGSLGLLPVGLLVFGIGLSLGGTTGYAINPARDLGPRIMHSLLPIPGKDHSDWGYSWIPVLGPILGAAAAAGVYKALVEI